jgi:hypothetical protein
MALFPLSKPAPGSLQGAAQKKPFSVFKWAAGGYVRGGVWGVKKAAAGVSKASTRAGSVASRLHSIKIVASDERPR